MQRFHLGRITTLSVALTIASCAPGSTGQNGADTDSLVVASVGEVDVTVSDFEESYIGFLISTGSNDTRRNRYRHLALMVDDLLLSDEARRRGFQSDSLYLAFRERERKKALGERFYETAFLEQLPDPTEEEIRAAFVRSKEQVVVRHLFYTSEAAADSAYQRILSGEDFLTEAQLSYKTTTFDSSAGFLGPVKYFMVDDAFAEAAFSLDVDSISTPVRSRFGYHIIRAEDKIRSPLIVESEYQSKRSGTRSNLRLRKMRLEGDRFVRDYMGSLNVEVNPASIRLLQEAIKEIENRVEPEQIEISHQYEVAPFSLADLRRELTESTVLLTYELFGQRMQFTAGEYYAWLRDLPFSEASNRTAASVGRALRNEVLALAAVDAGLESDPEVGHDVDRASRQFLAAMLRSRLRSTSMNPPTEELLEEAYRNLMLDKRKLYSGVFRVAPIDEQNHDAVLASVVEDPGRMRDLPGYQETESEDFAAEEWGRYAVSLPLGKPAIARQTAGKMAIVLVVSREVTTPSLDYYRDELVANLRPFVGEYELLRQLQDGGDVQVDSTLFERIMVLD